MPQSPPAQRLGARSRLRDPRLALGVGLIAVSVIAATAVVSSADDRVLVWAASHDLATGTVIGESDLVTVPVRLDAADAYLDSSSTRAVGQRLSRPVGTGELVPVAAVGAAPANHRLVTIAVEPLHVPPGLGHGDRVDVYVSSRESAIGNATSRLVMANALVDEAGDSAESTTGEIAVVLDVPVANAATLVSGGRGGVIDLARVPLGSA
ncbi:MAG: SAF domain-containing protein [Candidatus Nanopelagicales bacterium]